MEGGSRVESEESRIAWLACASGANDSETDDRGVVPLRPGKKPRVAIGDYFSVVGLHADENKLNAAVSKESLRETCGTFLVDITFVHSNPETSEPIPNGYLACTPPINGFLLCVLHCKDSPRMDYIIGVEIVDKDVAEAPGLEHVRMFYDPDTTKRVPITRRGKRSKDKDLYLMIKRASNFEASVSEEEKSDAQDQLKIHNTHNDDSSRFLEFLAHRPPGISSLLVVSSPHGVAPKSRAAPPPCVGNYQILERNLSRGNKEDFYLAVAFGPASGICDLPFVPQTVDRYPAVDHSDFQLPEMELPDFCFPHGLYLQHRLTTDAPRPKYFSFVLTSINGERIHVACLCFYEDLPVDLARQLRRRFSYIHRCERMMLAEPSSDNLPDSTDPGTATIRAAEQALHETSIAAAAVTAEVRKVVVETSAVAAAATIEAANVVGSTFASLISPTRETDDAGDMLANTKDAADSPISDDEQHLDRLGSKSDDDINELASTTPKGNGVTDVSAPKSTPSFSSPQKIRRRRPSISGEYRLYMPKCICIMSHFPFYRAMRRFLRQLYSISLSSSRIPIERYVSFFVSHLPFPTPGGAPLHVLLDGSLMESTPRTARGFSSSLPPIRLSHPKWNSMPGLDLDFLAPFRCLSVRNVLDIFALLLLEQQVLFVSSVSSLITEVMETMRTLLFPLSWQGAYVPRLPDRMAGFLDAPGGYMIGMHFEAPTTHEELRSQLGMEDAVVIVSLDGGGSLGYGYIPGIRDDQKPPHKRLPSKPLKDLERRLLIICKGTGVSPDQDLSYMDSAFEFSTPPSKMDSSSTRWGEEEVADKVRDAFLRFMIELFGTFRNYLAPVVSLSTTSNSDNCEESLLPRLQLDHFEQDRFLSECPAANKSFLECAVQTQMFSVLVSQHMTDYSHDHRMLFFDICVRETRARPPPKMSAKDIDDSNISETVLPVPLVQTDAVRRALMSALLSSTSIPTSTPKFETACVAPCGISDVFRVLSKIVEELDSDAIIVPGPTSKGFSSSSENFRYIKGWPLPLRSDLLNMPSSAVPKAVVELSEYNVSGIVEGSALSLVRSPAEMSSATALKTRSGVDLVVDVYGIVLIATPTIVACEPHLAVNHVLRALGMLHELEEKQYLQVVDAAIWRALMISCGLLGGLIMREVVVALYALMVSNGIAPTAVNYGQFVKAYQQERWCESATISSYAPPSMYGQISHRILEDLGWLWCRRKCPSLGGKLPEGGSHLESITSQGNYQSQARSTPGKRIFFPKTKRTSCDTSSNFNTKHASLGPAQMPPLFRGWVEYHDPHFFNSNEGSGNPLFGGSFWDASESARLEVQMRDRKLDENVKMAQSLRNIHRDPTSHDDLPMNKGMWSESTCPKCQHKILDEEIMALWGNQKHFITHDDVNIICPHCKTAFIPTLNVAELKEMDHFGPLFGMFSRLDDHFKANDSGNEPKASSLALQSSLDNKITDTQSYSHLSVIYLSPLILRVVLEDLLLTHGDDGLNDKWLAEHRPYFRWNMIWFCRRLHLPVPWTISPGSEDIYVAIGRERSLTTNAAANSIIRQSFPPNSPRLLVLFPESSQSEQTVLQTTIRILDECMDPIEGIRDSIWHLVGTPSPSISIRYPYMVLLKLISSFPLKGLAFVQWPSDEAALQVPTSERWIVTFDSYFREAIDTIPMGDRGIDADVKALNSDQLDIRMEKADLNGCLGPLHKQRDLDTDDRASELTSSDLNVVNLENSIIAKSSSQLDYSSSTSNEKVIPRFEKVDAGGCLGTLAEEKDFKPEPSAPSMMPPTPPSLAPPSPPPPSPPPTTFMNDEVRNMNHLAPMPIAAQYRQAFGSLLPGDH